MDHLTFSIEIVKNKKAEVGVPLFNVMISCALPRSEYHVFFLILSKAKIISCALRNAKEIEKTAHNIKFPIHDLGDF